MTTPIRKWMMASGIAITAAILLVGAAQADEIHLKDGTVVQGSLVRETDAFVQLKVRIGGVEVTRTFLKTDIKEHRRDAGPAVTPAAAPKAAAEGATPDRPEPAAATDRAGKTEGKARQIDSAVTRVAVLNFGAPQSWGDEIGRTVGVQITAKAWRDAVPMLKKDKVSVVVVRINSDGGSDEFYRFQDLFDDVYEKEFRTVGWVESAISAAAMAPYTIDELYFMPGGSFGGCVGWFGDLQSMQGVALEEVLFRMEQASVKGGRSPAIMRSMQVEAPLSATIDARTGEVTWFQDTTGDHLVNPAGQILTITSGDAVKFKFARGVAASRDELVKVMGLGEVEWAGEEAARMIDQSMREADKAENTWEIKYREFALFYSYAEQSQDRADRGKFVGKALSALRELRQLFKANPSLGMSTGINNAWFERNEDACRRLLRDNR